MALEDLILYHNDGWPIAAVEVKTKLRTTPAWAAQLRRNLLAHGGALPAEYFLLVTPDRIYLWRGGGTDPRDLPPTHVVDAQPIFEPYFAATHLRPNQIEGDAFELLVGSWLSDLTRLDPATDASGLAGDGLARSGLLTAIRSGRVEYPAAA